MLWSVSSALKTKEISKDHENFKVYATKLARLVKRIFIEFYNPAKKSVSEQMLNFANQMVFHVIQGRDSENIYLTLKSNLQSKNAAKISQTKNPDDRLQNQLSRHNKSSLMSQSASSLNLSHPLSLDSISNSYGSSSSINRSSSKRNIGSMLALRENFTTQSVNKSAQKFGSDSNLSRSKSSSSSNLMKAKRQISF